MKKIMLGFVKGLFSVIFSMLLIVSFVLFELILFIHAVGENIYMPEMGFISSDVIAVLFESWYAIAIGCLFILIPIGMLILINRKRIRRLFLAIGCSSVIAAVLSVTMVHFKTLLFSILSSDWQNIFVNATGVFSDFCVVCVIIFVALGATCLSVYSCINIIKGGNYEQAV